MNFDFNTVLGGMAHSLGFGPVARPSTPSTPSSVSRAPSLGASMVGSYPAAPYPTSFCGGPPSPSGASAGLWGAPRSTHSYAASGAGGGVSIGIPAASGLTPEEVAKFFDEGFSRVTFDTAAAYYHRASGGGFILKDYWGYKNDQLEFPLKPEDTYQVGRVGYLIRMEEVAGFYPHVMLTPSMARSFGFTFQDLFDSPTSFLDWTYGQVQAHFEYHKTWSHTLAF